MLIIILENMNLHYQPLQEKTCFYTIFLGGRKHGIRKSSKKYQLT
jgi:hypothetical protein